jgi:hypothetical protein
MAGLVQWAGHIMVELIRRCRPAKIAFAQEKIHAVGFAKARQGWRGPDVVFPDIVFDCQDMPEWHEFRLNVGKEMKLLGVTLDRKLTWRAHVTACTQKAKKLLTRLRICVKAKWGLGLSAVKRLYKGAVEPVLLNGVAV